MNHNLLFIALLLSYSTSGQSWQAAGLPVLTVEMSEIFSDGDSVLYFCGESSLNGDFDFSDQVISTYRNGGWSHLGAFNNRPMTIRRYGDTLVVGGGFNQVNGQSAQGCAAFYQGTWIPFGDFSNSVYRLRFVDNVLYAIGGFSVVDGQSANGIARRVGGSWEPVGVWDVSTASNIQDIVIYDDTLYATGTIAFNGSQANHLARLVNGIWQPVGQGIQGGLSAGRSMAVYENELYISGSIDVNSGNAGHGIMKWSNGQFSNVGSGLQGPDNGTGFLVGGVAMKTSDSLLWVSGTFSFAGNVMTPGIASWNGSVWCASPQGPQLEINAFEFFQDSLFVGCFQNLVGVNVNCAAVIDTDSSIVSCAPVSIPENSGMNSISIWPNPVSSILKIESINLESLQIYTNQGVRIPVELLSPIGEIQSIDVTALPPGVYFAVVSGNGYYSGSRFVVAR